MIWVSDWSHYCATWEQVLFGVTTPPAVPHPWAELPKLQDLVKRLRG